ncbi:MAG: ATP-dependent helicase HrpB [Deltaproteobacteria bacterium]|nr:ATP-dependent helicase HrpB [Deltaproteobacteria bacterium]
MGNLITFPVDAALPALAEALATRGRAILVAPPGSGKTTRVPLALAGLTGLGDSDHLDYSVNFPFPGKILVLEPRRLAARAAAAFMARQLGEAVGQRVGYRVRLEQKTSAATRVELLTEGMLTRRLLADPELRGVSCIIFDEFHERSLQADLGLALCLEAAEVLRPDLRLLVMSATLEVDPLRRLLGDCPLIRAEGRQWPVTVRHAARGDCPPSPRPKPRELAAKMAQAVLTTLRDESGSILAFLPGSAEIRQTAEILHTALGSFPAVAIHPLYGDLPPEEQDAAIAPPLPGRRKVVLATDIAQTSLTIEGVRVVIDSGLNRVARFDPATGMNGLITIRASRDDAEQRAGRAGRIEAGSCLRLWPQGEFLPQHSRPEILDADLTSLLLDALVWGASGAGFEDLPWLTPPPQTALDFAARTLLALGAAEAAPTLTDPQVGTSTKLRVTAHGQALARLPLHPRLGHMVLCANGREQPQNSMPNSPDEPNGWDNLPNLSALAASLAAIITERDPLRIRGQQDRQFGQIDNVSADIRLRLPLLRMAENHRLRAAAEQIYRADKAGQAFRLPTADEEDFSGALLSLAWPERIAMRRPVQAAQSAQAARSTPAAQPGAGKGEFLLASGQGAGLPADDALADAPWLAVAVVSAPSEQGGQRIRLAAPLRLEDLLRLHGNRLQKQREIKWDSRTQTVICRELTRLDALILEEKPLNPATIQITETAANHSLCLALSQAVKTELIKGIQELGPDCLPWTEGLRQWQARVLLLRALHGAERQTGSKLDAPYSESNTGAAGSKTDDNSWPDVSDAALLLNPQDWLSPWLDGLSRRQHLDKIDLKAALASLLPWDLARRLDEEAPASLIVPSGSRIDIDYRPALNADGGLSGARPVLAVKLQEMFGLAQTPTVASGRCPLSVHLLSPAGRPLQITSDLAHFWANGYAQVRAEMRGRYPKHPWPEDPATAMPTRKTKRSA